MPQNELCQSDMSLSDHDSYILWETQNTIYEFNTEKKKNNDIKTRKHQFILEEMKQIRIVIMSKNKPILVKKQNN